MRGASALLRSCSIAVAAFVLACWGAHAHAQTLEERFAAHLKALEQREADAVYWHLAEAQRLAPLLPDGERRLLAPATRLATRGKAPWLQGEALGTLAGIAQARDPEAARRHVREAGVLASGAVLGPLGGPGSDGDAAAGRRFDPAARVPGQQGEVGWRTFEDAALQGPLQLPDLLDTPGDAHALVVHFLEVQRPVDAMLVLSSNGPLAAWLDDQPLVSWDGTRRFSDWQHAVPVRLAAGAHELVVRVGSRTTAPLVMARLVDARGRLPAGVTLVAPAAGRKLAAWKTGARLPPPLDALGGTDPAVRGRHLLQFAEETERARRAAEQIEAALKARPEDAELWYLLGRAEHDDPDARRAAFEQAVARSEGRHAEALAELVALHRDAGLYDAADALSRALAAVDADHPARQLHTLVRLAQLTDAQTALASLPEGFLAADGELQATVASLYDRAGRATGAAERWRRLAQLAGGSPQPVHAAVQAARRAGNLALAEEICREALLRRPWNVQLHLVLARTLAAGPEGPRPGIRLVRQALRERHPHSADLFELLGRLLLLRDRRADAIAAFDEALALRPQDRNLVEYRRALVSGRSMAQDFARPLAEVVAAAPAARSGRGATVLHHMVAVRVFDSGLSSRFEQKVVRVESEHAAEGLREVVLPFTPGEDRLELLEAEVHHADGRISRPDAVFESRPDGKHQGVYALTAYRVVRFPPLQPGDVVHTQTRRDEISDRNMFGRFFGVVVPLSDEHPKARVEVVIDAPAARPLFANAVRIGAPERRSEGERQQLRWRVDGLPAVHVEPQMPGYGGVGAYVNVSTYESWEALAAWYRELVGPQLVLSPDLRRLAERLVEGKTGVRERAAAIVEWVVRNTRYVGIEFGIHGFKPYRVTQVVARGYGDCKDKASLLVALLEAVGIEAEFVLVRTRDLGPLEERPATLWAFNHAIAYIPALETYVDGTSEHAGLGEVPQADQGALVLRVDLGEGAGPPVLTTLPMSRPADNTTVSRGTVRLESSGAALMERTETVSGTEAPSVRRLLAAHTKRDRIVAGLVGQVLPGAELQAVSYEGLDTLGAPVSVTTRILAPRFATAAADGLNVPVAVDPGDVLKRWGALAERKQPLVIDHPVREQDVTEVTVPEGAQAVALPAAVKLDTPFGRYGLEVTAQAGGFRMEELLEIAVAEVAPADYPAFRRFLGEIVAARSQAVHVRLGGVQP